MGSLLKLLMVLVFFSLGLLAEESEAEKLCDAEIRKEHPQKDILEKQCILVAKEFEIQKQYGNASWYYLVGGENSYNIGNIAKKIPKNGNWSNVAHSFVVDGDMKNAKKNYIRYLKIRVIPDADRGMKGDYKFLFKLYPNKKKQLGKGLELWKEIYKPLKEINNLYPRYVMAKENEKYSEAIDLMKKIIEIQKKSKLQNELSIAKNIFALGILYNKNKEYKKSLKTLKKIKNIYKNRKDDYENLISWINYSDRKFKMKYIFSLLIKHDFKSLNDFNKKTLKNKEILIASMNDNFTNDLLDFEILKYLLDINYDFNKYYFNKKEDLYISPFLYSLLNETFLDNKKRIEAIEFLMRNNVKFESKNNDETVERYVTLGKIYEKARNYNKALFYYKKSIDMSPKALDLSDSFYMGEGCGMFVDGIENDPYHSIAELLYYSKKNSIEAYPYLKKFILQTFQKTLNQRLLIRNREEQGYYVEAYLDDVEWLFEMSAENKLKGKSKNYDLDSINIWLNYKGAIFDSENTIASLYENTKNQTLKKKIELLISKKRALAKLYQSIPKKKKAWQVKIQNTKKDIVDLTNALSSTTQSFKEQQGLTDIKYHDISKNLKKDELYIDYAKTLEFYYIFSIDKQENITFTQIDKKSTQKINQLVKTFREDIQTILKNNKLTKEQLKTLTEASKEKLSKLYALALAKPLGKLLEDKKSLIISTDGALKLLPFEAMFDQKSQKYLIESKNIRYTPSGKELVRLYKYGQKNQKVNAQSVIFSNPNFDAKNSAKKEQNEEVAIMPNTSRAGIIKSLFKMRFSPLAGTKEEAESIKATLKDKTEIVEYSQDRANETNLMKVKQPKMLHIATHGFFINDNSIPNPMLKSGIALSGANASAIRGKSDGIITALKLSGLQLRGTDLVVLSACETGVVDIDSTDSVSGLSKAFIQAGAKDIVMSLWSVNDQATKDLMSSFYTKIGSEKNYAHALQKAKMEMVNKGMHPFYWAGFVVSGL